MEPLLHALELKEGSYTRNGKKVAGLGTVSSDTTSDMQGLVWGEPELAHKYDFDVEDMMFEECILFI